PYGEQQLVSDEFRGRLHTITDEEDLDELYEIAADEAEAIDFTKQITDPNETIRILEVLLTEHAAEQFRAIWHHDRPNAKEFKLCFERMRFATQLRTLSHDIYSRKLSKGEHDIYSQDLSSLTFHFGKRRRTTQRPVFHTVPKDIKNCADKEVDRVIISELEMKANGKYRQLEQIITSLAFPLGPFMAVNELIAKLQKSTQEPSIILVPLGATPMIATQFYTLRTAEGQTIREVVLLYPSGMPAMRQSAEVAKSAFDDEKIACRSIPIPELKDIDSKDACEIYEKKLEETIDDICQRHSGVQIDLLLSGGRKGMAALAMFVAQRKGIRYLYHTLINDVELNRRVEEETKVSALNLVKIDRRERNNRLFLRAYEGEGPYEKFVCFKIPVLPGGKK
ncbi:MAG TPA: CRISPR-associated ring nuclease, partial [Ktedonobacteraceae bacterium]|nr:CRISPR-associated ring nuclease [Ktedonobacteraceae bacterium]